MIKATGLDLVGAIREVLCRSSQPLTVPRIRRALPMPLGSVPLETLTEVVKRQVAAHIFILYPKYRSRQDRYWDRPLRLHLEQLLRRVLREGPRAWSDIRRRLPDYAKSRAVSILEEMVARGRIFRHPPVGRRGARFGLGPPQPRTYVRPELEALFRRLETLGFARGPVRASVLEILRGEERVAEREARLFEPEVNYTLRTARFADVLEPMLVGAES